MFLSTFESGLDSKGRISVPAPFRAALGGGSRIFIWPAVDGLGYLEGGGEALMASYRQILLRMSPQDPARRAFMHAIFTRSADLKMDDPGRIKLPERLLKAAQITDRVLFAGAFDRFHIWNPDQFEAYDAQMLAQTTANPDPLRAPFEAALAAGALPGLTGSEGEDA